MSVLGQFLRNVVTSYLGTIVSLAITFFFTPYLIGRLGQVEYGIWTLVFSIITYMELADLGMRQSLVRNLSKYFAKEDWTQVNQVFSSSVRIYVGVGVIVQVTTLIVAYYFLDSFKIPDGYFEVARATLLVIGTNQAISFMLIPCASLGPYHRFDIHTWVNIGGKIIQTAGMVALLEYGLGLVEMACLVFGIGLLSRLSTHYIRTRMFPRIRFAFASIDKEKTKELVNYALYSFLIVAMWIVIFQTDNIVIGRFISMEAVAVFSVGAALITQLRGLIYGVAVPLVPAISHFDAEKDYSKILTVYDRSTRYLYYVCGWMAISILVFGGPFIKLWVGEEFAKSVDIMHILIVPAVISFPQLIANSILYGISKHKVTLYVLVAEGTSNIILSLILVNIWGIYGVAVGTAAPQLIIYTLVYPIMFYRTIGAKVAPFYSIAGRSLLYSVFVVLPLAYICRALMEPSSWLPLFSGAILTTVGMAAGFYVLIIEPSDKKKLIEKLRNIITRRGKN